MTYRVRLNEEARRSLPEVPGNYRQRIRRAIDRLVDEPRPENARRLRDQRDRYRIRLDNWRIIYQVDDLAGEIIVLRVKQKSGPETYEGLG